MIDFMEWGSAFTQIFGLTALVDLAWRRETAPVKHLLRLDFFPGTTEVQNRSFLWLEAVNDINDDLDPSLSL